MAGTVEVVEERFGVGCFRKLIWSWTSDGAGAANGVSTGIAYNGKIEHLTTIPDGAAAPSAAYDVALKDQDGVDVLMGAGANRSATAIEQVGAATLGVVANDLLTLEVTNAGAAKKGTVIVFIR
ncbi:MAG: hypothetical protein KJ067_23195 [Vicinamibacteria bacterium]|nr:hypothetical protein [Vicinamibacteria bacterium]